MTAAADRISHDIAKSASAPNKRSAKAGALALLVAIACSGCAITGWSHIAYADPAQASAAVGGFSPEDAALYKRGIQRLKDKNLEPAGFTIGQIVDREKATEAGIATRGQRQDAERAIADFDTYLVGVNGQIRLAVVRDRVVDASGVAVRVYTAQYASLSRDNKDRLNHLLEKAWGMEIARNIAPEDVPTNYRVFKIIDTSGNVLYRSKVKVP